MQRLLPLIFLIFIFSCYYSSSQYFLKFQQESGIIIPEKWSNEEIIALEDSLNIIIDKRGENNVTIEKSITYFYINNTENEALKVISFFEDSEIEEYPTFEVSALYPSGGTWKADIYDFSETPYSYSGEYLTDDMIHSVEIPHYSKGMIIRVAKKRNFVMPEFSSEKFIRGKYPILKKHIEFTQLTDSKWKHKLLNIENLPIDTSAVTVNGYKKFIVSADTLEKLPDHDIPNPEEWFCGLHISIPHKGKSSHTWETIGNYYLSLVYKNQEKGSPDLTNFVDKSGIDKNSNTEVIISKAFSFIQNNIRYYANMEDEHSYIPRSIPDILSKGYGDCKEMSVLLQGMLYRLGVKSDLALVGTKGSCQYLKDIPTLSAFNHIIVYRQDQKGNITYYDPTVDYGKASNSYMNLIGQKTLLLKRNKSYPDKIKRTGSHKNLFVTKSEVINDSLTDTWKLSGSLSLTGEAAYTIFPYMKKLHKEEMQPFLKSFLKEFFDFNTTNAFIDSSSDEFCRIRYNADFQSNFIKLEEGGFRLSSPSLFPVSFWR